MNYNQTYYSSYVESVFERVFYESLREQTLKKLYVRFHEMVESDFITRRLSNSSDDGHRMQRSGYNFAADVDFENDFLLDKNNQLTDHEFIERILEWNKKSHSKLVKSKFLNQELIRVFLANFLCGMDIYKKVCAEYEERKINNSLPIGFRTKKSFIKAVGDGLLYNKDLNKCLDGYLSSDEKSARIKFVDSVCDEYFNKNGYF